ncbi:pectate lyase family protein [Adhaeribacter aquaticus]|uniref:pectate lyase family protein n=1 Tax=Adhaeribacter aquaticus TaxID=299567 RepID=UPI00040BC676|nr:pectate lyase [Adhaeribacter aquaticus]
MIGKKAYKVKVSVFYLVLQVVFTAACSQQPAKTKTDPIVVGRAIAFPGAEGFGKYTKGGRGGKVFVVTNLNDSGPGSLREAVEAKTPRIIVFAVSGTIHLESELAIRANVTIAGQTAPGDGICLADYPVKINADNVIIRYMRFRMGDRHQNNGMLAGSGHDDALSSTKKKNIIIDHCSISWSTDEVLSVYAGDSTTLQWNLMAEPLNYSYHFEAGDKDFERHGYGGILGGRHISIHHNLYAHCVSRTPRFDGNRNISPDVEFADFRNNIIYNWGSNNVYAGEGGQYNIVNNYYKYGPDTKKNVKNRVLNPFRDVKTNGYGKFYVTGNYSDESPEVTQNNWLGVVMDKGTAADTTLAKATEPFVAEKITTQAAPEAYALVLQQVGASLPKRDPLDQRVLNEVKSRTGKIIDVQGGFPHGTPYAESQKAWPELKSKAAPADSDKDGMPDAWEKQKGLNPQDANDSKGFKLDKFYTNLEVYLNSITSSSL